MTVYADVVFAVNTVVNYLLLLLGARLTGFAARPRRVFLGASVGGCYAVAVLFPMLSLLEGIFGKVLCFFLMSLVAYGAKKKSVRPGAVSFLCACALAGAILLLGNILPSELITFGGGVYYASAQKLLLLMAGIFYLSAALLLTGTMKHGAGETVLLQLECENRKILISALLDTGNTLCDAVTGKPVLVMEWQRGAALLGRTVSGDLFQNAPSAMEHLQKLCPGIPFRLVPYRAVGTENGLLVAVPCTASFGKNRKMEILAAFSPGAVSDGGGYEALIGGTVF